MTELRPDPIAIDTEEPAHRPSKTQLKRRSAALHELGGELLRLAPDQLDWIELPGELVEALRLAQTMKRDGAFARQRKYIGKLLRGIDPAPIQARIAELALANAAATRSLHHIEAWRDRLIAEGTAALGEFMAEFPFADRTKLRGLIGSARREKQQQEPPRSARLLFKYVRSITENAGNQPNGDH